MPPQWSACKIAADNDLTCACCPAHISYLYGNMQAHEVDTLHVDTFQE